MMQANFVRIFHVGSLNFLCFSKIFTANINATYKIFMHDQLGIGTTQTRSACRQGCKFAFAIQKPRFDGLHFNSVSICLNLISNLLLSIIIFFIVKVGKNAKSVSKTMGVIEIEPGPL